ncbi:MAG: DUF4417 domain-containing protein [Selenomonadaceae bacterium]|nr:DUF4417 domain-containing protein [Selenomonadaceae bacterium]
MWTKPYKALEKLRQCAGVITPDFSTWQDDPEPIKLYNTYRMRAFGLSIREIVKMLIP